MTIATNRPDATLHADPALLDAAHAAGIPVITRLDLLDPGASRAVPPDLGVVGVRWHEGFLIVAWPHLPTPAEVARVQARIGTPIVPSVAPGIHGLLADKASIEAVTTRQPIERILHVALAKRASDVHLAVGVPPMIRVAQELTAVDGWGPLTTDDVVEMCEYLAGDVLERGFDGDYDGSTTYGSYRFRVNIARQRETPSITLRIIPLRVPTFESLGLPASVAELADFSNGLVLVCGPTGSGKSTTLATLVDRINRERACHIVTIEDPIEYTHASRKALVRQREVGTDTPTFTSGLRAALRMDPDVLLVGEMRDLETISLAVTAAETGHLTLATVHASTAQSTIDRVVDVFPAQQQGQIRAQLANTLRAVVCQTRFTRADDPGASVVVCEVMVMTQAIANTIRDGENHRIGGAIQTGIETHGMQPFDLGLARAVNAGKITYETALGSCQNEAEFRDYLKVAARGLQMY
jgi:twitching motility protein PilT